MRLETPIVNSSTCFLMYFKKARLDHQPTNIIVNSGTPFRYICMAADDLTECKPMSSTSIPSDGVETNATCALSMLRDVVESKVHATSLSFRNVYMGVPGENF